MPNKSYILFFLFLPLIWLSCQEKKAVVDKQTYWDIIQVRTMGLAYLEENKLPEAEAEFHRLVELAPDRALGYANLGLVYLRMENYPEAENQLIKAIEKDPGDPDIRLILVKVYELSGKRDRAVKELLKSGKLNVSEVRYAVGFQDPEYFRQVFKEHFEQTPSEFISKNNTSAA